MKTKMYHTNKNFKKAYHSPEMAKVATRRPWVKFSGVINVDKDMVKLQIIN